MTETYRYPLNTTQQINFREIPAWIFQIAHYYQKQGKQIYLVGGAVRDLIWGNTPADWDLATDALPDETETYFPGSIPTGKPYGTVTILYDTHTIEVTTLREDLQYSDGRRPDSVKFSNDIIADLARRDFTINAMAYDLIRLELVDPFAGRHDCQQRILKAVGQPELRFAEDGLRMLRFFRFLATCQLKPERRTLKAINPEWLKPISQERIRDEFSKLILGKYIRTGLNGLRSSGLLKMFIPELEETSIAQGRWHSRNLWEHLLVASETITPKLPLRLAALFHDIAKPQTLSVDEKGIHFYGHDQKSAESTEVIMQRLRYPSKITQDVIRLIRHHMFFIPPEVSDAAIRRLIAKVGPENIFDLMELRCADLIATGNVNYQTWAYWQEIVARVTAIANTEPTVTKDSLAINGTDLIDQFQLEPGPLIGKILAYLWEKVLDDPSSNQKEILLEFARKYLNS